MPNQTTMSKDPALDPFIPQELCCEILGVSRDTIGNLRKSGKLKAVRVSSRRVGVRLSELTRYIREQEEQG